MSAPNGQTGATTPSNVSTPVSQTGTGNSASSSRTMRAPTQGGRQQVAQGSQSAGQDMSPRTPGNGRTRGLASSSTSRATSQAPSVGGQGQGTRSVLGRTFADAFKDRLAKRSATAPLAIPRDQLSVKTNDLNETIDMRPKDPSLPSTNFMTQSHTTMCGIEMRIDPRVDDGWETLLGGAKTVHQRFGNADLLITIAPMQNTDARSQRLGDDRSECIPPARAGVQDRLNEEFDSVDEETLQMPVSSNRSSGRQKCWACGSPYHMTGNCHIPSADGMTPICPYHRVSAKAPKGVSTHSLDARARHQRNDPNKITHCMKLIEFEDSPMYDDDDVYRKRLAEAFRLFVVERIRKPFCRVVKGQNCPIGIAIEYANIFCQRQMPEELSNGWPYTKRDTRDPAILGRLQQCREHNWRDMPQGELEKMSWKEITVRYRNGTLEKQVHDPEAGRRGRARDIEILDDTLPKDGAVKEATEANTCPINLPGNQVSGARRMVQEGTRQQGTRPAAGPPMMQIMAAGEPGWRGTRPATTATGLSVIQRAAARGSEQQGFRPNARPPAMQQMAAEWGQQGALPAATATWSSVVQRAAARGLEQQGFRPNAGPPAMQQMAAQGPTSQAARSAAGISTPQRADAWAAEWGW